MFRHLPSQLCAAGEPGSQRFRENRIPPKPGGLRQLQQQWRRRSCSAPRTQQIESARLEATKANFCSQLRAAPLGSCGVGADLHDCDNFRRGPPLWLHSKQRPSWPAAQPGSALIRRVSEPAAERRRSAVRPSPPRRRPLACTESRCK